MWNYNTNLMGPMLHWFQDNNIPYTIKIANNKFTNFKDEERKVYEQWYCGRIDCRCDNTEDKDYDGFGRELGLPIMKGESYGKFSNWLLKFSSDKLLTFEELVNLFEKETNYKIIIWENED